MPILMFSKITKLKRELGKSWKELERKLEKRARKSVRQPRCNLKNAANKKSCKMGLNESEEYRHMILMVS